jgi:hypothetical protein
MPTAAGGLAQDAAPRVPSRSGNRLLAALSARDFAVLEPHLRPVRLARGQIRIDPGHESASTI